MYECMNECMYTHMMDDLMINDLMMDDLMVDGQMTLKKKEEGPKSDRTLLQGWTRPLCPADR